MAVVEGLGTPSQLQGECLASYIELIGHKVVVCKT
jgi:hypothetical protein